MLIFRDFNELAAELLDHEAAAALAGLTRVGFDYWVHTRKAGPPSVRKGTSRLYLRRDVARWRDERLAALKPGEKRRRKKYATPKEETPA